MADQNNVKVIEKNAGPKIAYDQTGTCLIFGDYELMINAAKYQKDWDVTVDICKDKAGNLTIGTESGLRYVAQVMIRRPPTPRHRSRQRKGPSLWQKEVVTA